jgi:hypothetical protein
MTLRIPDIDGARIAYIEDRIDLDTYEQLIDAALTRTPTEVPSAVVICGLSLALRDPTKPQSC